MSMDEKATTSTLVIVVASMIIMGCLTVAFGFFAGIAGALFCYMLFFMLDSIDCSLSRIAEIAGNQERQKKQLRARAESYDTKGVKTDLTA